MALLAGEGQYSKAFAARGLGTIHHAGAVQALLPIAADVARQPAVGVEAIRALGAIKAPDAAPVLLRVARQASNDAAIRAEALAALAGAGSTADAEALLDLLSDRSPAVRAAAFRALAGLDAERFLLALSGLDADAEPSVRSAVATAAGTLPAEVAAKVLLPIRETDVRVLPAIFAALAAAKVPGAEAPLVAALAAGDVVVRGAAADALGALKAAGAVAPLTATLQIAQKDTDYGARASILGALVAIDRAAAGPALTAALADPDWAVRRRAAALIAEIDPSRDTAAAIRPAPTELVRRVYEDPAVLSPRYSTHVYIESDKGTIEIELAMLDAPLTAHNFVALARRGYFDGLAFHRVVRELRRAGRRSRGDGEGGPGYTIRDELNERPFQRGAVGMALAGPDTGGSQYFITLSPQPHLDARYTVFGQVVAGMEVVDAHRARRRGAAGASLGWGAVGADARSRVGLWPSEMRTPRQRLSPARPDCRRRETCGQSPRPGPYTKMGANRAPNLSRRFQRLPLLARLLLGALGCFLGHAPYPPFPHCAGCAMGRSAPALGFLPPGTLTGCCRTPSPRG